MKSPWERMNIAFAKDTDLAGGGTIDPKAIQDAVSSAVSEAVTSALKTAIPEIVKTVKSQTASDIKEAITPLKESLDSFQELVNSVSEGEDLEEGEEEDDEIFLDDDLDGEDDNIKQATNTALKNLSTKFKREFDEFKGVMDAQVQDLQAQLQAEREEKAQIQNKNIEGRIKTEVASILGDEKVVSIDGGLKWFGDKVKYDKESDSVVFVDPEGNQVNLKKGITENIPEWLKGARGGNGAGTNRAGEKTNQELNGQTEIEQKIAQVAAQLDEAKALAEVSQQDGDIAKFQGLARELGILKQQQESGNSQI